LRRLRAVRDELCVLEGDLADIAALRSALRESRPACCIHCAWYAEPGRYLHASENIQCLSESLALLRELIAVGCRQVIMVGSCAEYETDAGFLQEDGATRPVTLYGAAKLALGLVGAQLAQQAAINFAWARLFYLYGPEEDERRLVPALIKALSHGQPFPATPGEQVRDYLHVADVASALLTLANHNGTGTYNIASGLPVTVRQLAETVGELVGRPQLIRFGAVPYRDWEPPFICGDSRRLRALGWSPRTLRVGLEQTVEWWRHAASDAANIA
jgi:nucleoside-diphosphate-sugar epimerase